MQDKEQLIIAVSGTATKVTGTATAVSSTAGFWAFLIDHQQPILILCAVIGAVVTIIMGRINSNYQKKRDTREQHSLDMAKEEHAKEMAIKDYQLQKMKQETGQKRRQTDEDLKTLMIR